MLCPNCRKEMKFKHEVRHHLDFSGTAEDDELEYDWFQWRCGQCRIAYDGEWDIPKKYAPTEKQRKTILFINGRLGLHLEALTKHQCWLDIGKYFDDAKDTPYGGAWPEEDDDYNGPYAQALAESVCGW